MIQITVLYPSADFPALDDKIRELIQQFGGDELGSGCDFGQRDICVIFPTFCQQTHAFMERCIGLPGCELQVVKFS